MHNRRRRQRNGDERHLWAVPLVLLLGATLALGIFASRFPDTIHPDWSRLITPEVAIASNSHAGSPPSDPSLVRATASLSVVERDRIPAYQQAKEPAAKRADLYSVMDAMRSVTDTTPTERYAAAEQTTETPLPVATPQPVQPRERAQAMDSVGGRSLGNELAAQALLAGIAFAANTGINETVADVPEQDPITRAVEEATSSIAGLGTHAGAVRASAHGAAAPVAVEATETAVATQAPTAAPTEVTATPEPTQTPTQAPATPVPTQTPTQAPATLEPTQMLAVAPATEAPTEAAPAQVTTAPTRSTSSQSMSVDALLAQANQHAQQQRGDATQAPPTDAPATQAPATEAPTQPPTPVPTLTASPQPTSINEFLALADKQIQDTLNAQAIDDIEAELESKVEADETQAPTGTQPTASPTPEASTEPLTLAELPPYPREGDQIGTLRIDTIELEASVYQGDTNGTLHEGIGHALRSTIPGEGDNIVLYAYSDTYFKDLGELVPGNTVTFETAYGTYVYRVTETAIFEPDDDSYLTPKGKELLTMYTEYPFDNPDNALHRYAVIAKLIEGEPVSWEE